MGGTAVKWLFGTVDNYDLELVNDKISLKTDGMLNVINEQVTIINQVDSKNQKMTVILII